MSCRARLTCLIWLAWACRLTCATYLLQLSHKVAPRPSKARQGSRSVPWDEALQKAQETEGQLTTEERNGLVRGVHFSALMIPDPGYYTGNTLPVPRLGVPALKMQDASQGFRVTPPYEEGTTTAWPSMLALASTWDEKVVADVAAGVAKEFSGKGANTILGPSLNVHRVARNGRNFEYLSGEDPYLGARLAAAHVAATQAEGILAVAKHFAFNEQETNRMTESSAVDAKTMWELYYPPFQAAVDAGLGAVMCAYNKVNGTYSSENHNLLVRDLREVMGFKGLVMSDWSATHSMKAIENGLSMEQPGLVQLGPFSVAGLFTDANLATVPAESVHGAARDTLAAIYHLGLDVQPGCAPPCHSELSSNVTGPESRELARQAASKAITLLKNANGVLPIEPEKVKTIAVLGSAADAPAIAGPAPDYYAGGGSGKVVANYVVTALQGIAEQAASHDIKVLHCASAAAKDTVPLIEEADLVIVVGATTSTEGSDRANLTLDNGVDDLISTVAGQKPTVVLMQTPGAVLTPWRDQVEAIANLFLGGEETGHAWGRFLFGDEAPTGRLPIMLPATEADAISPTADPDVVYSEGLLTSYRNPNFKAAFPFGHGLSFTTFSYGAPEEVTGDSCGAAACVSVKIENTGARSGSEVAQAYLHLPTESQAPQLTLKGFVRTGELAPGQSQVVVFEFTSRDLSVYGAEDGWVQLAGVEVHVGSSSEDIHGTVALTTSS